MDELLDVILDLLSDRDKLAFYTIAIIILVFICVIIFGLILMVI